MEKILELLKVEKEEDAVRIISALMREPLGINVIVDGVGRVSYSTNKEVSSGFLEQIFLECLRIAVSDARNDKQ